MTRATELWIGRESGMSARIRDHDWSATPLGPIGGWSERFKVMVEQVLASPLVSSLACGHERILVYNDAAARLYGDRHPGALGRPLPETFPDTWPVVASLYERVFLGESVHVSAQPLDLGGGEVFDAYLTPVRDEAGAVVAAHMVGFEIGDRLRTEAALRESEERYRGLVEGFSQFSWEASPDGAIVADSPGWRAFTGQRLDEWQGSGWLDAIHVDDRAETESKWRAAVAAGRPVDAEYRLWHAPSASWRWSNVRVVPITRHDGTIRKWAGVNIDVNDRRMLQARLEVLVNELQHRARNLLGVVAAIADRTVKRGGSVEAFEERLQALSRAQGLLSRGGTDTVEVGALVRAELAAHVDEASDRIEIGGPQVLLTAQQVQNFALALHELTTNAVKYGALKGGAGSLAVTWDVARDRRGRRRLALSWIETGIRVDPEKTTHRGYGTELIQQALAYALQASVDYALGEDGVRCRIDMPITCPV